MIGVMSQYMICKSIPYGEQSSSKVKIFIWISLHHERCQYQCKSLAW